MTVPRTELQVLLQALTAIQYEIKAMTLSVRPPDFVKGEMFKLQREAKELMQSAVADGNLMAVLAGHLAISGSQEQEGSGGWEEEPHVG